MKQLLIVVIVVGALFTFLQFSNSSLIGDDDVYWHLRYSHQLLEPSNWTREYFSNPIPYAGVLFHVVLAVFTVIPNLFVAEKVAGIFFAVLVASLAFWILHKEGIRNPALWTIAIFLVSVNFSFRLLLVRTFLMAIVFLLCGVYCMINRKHWWLFIVSVAFGLSYSIPFLLVVALAYIFAEICTLPRKEVRWYLPFIVLGGIMAGMGMHPAFPENITFLIQQVFPVVYRVPIKELNGGIELKPLSFWDFIRLEGFVLMIWLPSLIVFVKNYVSSEEKTKKLFLQLVSLGFFVLAILFRRFIEYWPLFAILAAAFVFKPYINKLNFSQFKKSLSEFWQIKFATGLIAVILLGLAYLNVSKVCVWAAGGASINQYVAGGEWMHNNIPAGSLVLNSDWSLYPKLYFYQPKANYVAIFDPANLYLKDYELYKKWYSIANDRVEDWENVQGLHKIVRDDFKAQYLLLKTNQNAILLKYIDDNDSKQQYFSKIYTDSAITIYQIVP